MEASLISFLVALSVIATSDYVVNTMKVTRKINETDSFAIPEPNATKQGVSEMCRRYKNKVVGAYFQNTSEGSIICKCLWGKPTFIVHLGQCVSDSYILHRMRSNSPPLGTCITIYYTAVTYIAVPCLYEKVLHISTSTLNLLT